MNHVELEQTIDAPPAGTMATVPNTVQDTDTASGGAKLIDLVRRYEDGQRQIVMLAESLASAERRFDLTQSRSLVLEQGLAELQATRNEEAAKINELHALFFAEGEDAVRASELRQILARQQQELVAKERVIREMDDALRRYRAAHPVLRPVATLKRVVRRVLGPRIGTLYHHAPRPLREIPPVGQVAGAPLPSIALVTPSFGQAAFVGDTVASVLEQNYPGLDYLVQDGGSTDGTPDILASFGDAIRWDSRRDGGQAQAINVGFSKVSGEIMGYLNSDDLLLPGALHAVGRFFAEHPEVDVVYGDRLIVNKEGLEIGAWRLPAHRNDVLSWADYVPQETLFWRRSAWERAGGTMDETFRFALDWDLLLRLRDSGARFAHLPAFLGAFRVHADQKTSAQIADIGVEEMGRLRRRALGFDPSHEQIRRAIRPYVAAHVLTDVQARIRGRLRAWR